MQRSIRPWVALCVAALLAFVLAEPADAQIFETVGIRAQGMGGAFVAVSDDATATWWNPAGLANGAFFSSLLEWDRRTDPDGTRARAFAVAYPALGISYYRLALSGIRAIGPTDAASSGRQDQQLNLFGATVGQSIGSYLVLASTVKVVHALDQTRGDLDVGAMAAAGRMRLGLTVKNVTRPEFSDGAELFELPRQARVGMALRAGPPDKPAVIVAIDADLTKTSTPVGDARHLAAGVEVWKSRQLGLRAGIGMNTTGESRRSASFGISLALRAGFYADFQGTGGQDDIRNGWGLGLRVTF